MKEHHLDHGRYQVQESIARDFKQETPQPGTYSIKCSTASFVLPTRYFGSGRTEYRVVSRMYACKSQVPKSQQGDANQARGRRDKGAHGEALLCPQISSSAAAIAGPASNK